MQLNFKNDWPGPRYWNLTIRASYSKDLHDVTLRTKPTGFSQTERWGGGGKRGGGDGNAVTSE